MIKIEVHEGKLPWIVGIGTILFGIMLIVLAMRHPDDSSLFMAGSYLVMILIIAAGIWLCMDGRNRKLTVEDMSLCYSDWLGRKKNFSLDEIGYGRAALEAGGVSGKAFGTGSKDYLKLYNLHGEKLCKLEFNMQNMADFLQYLLDNQVKVEYTEKSDSYLKIVINTKTICREEIQTAVNDFYDKARDIVWEWVKMHSRFGAEWKTGIAVYLEEKLSGEKQLWEQEGYDNMPFSDKAEGKSQLSEEDKDMQASKLPEGYLIALEGYLQKDGQFVVDKKNRAVAFFIPIINVTKSMRIGETLKICYFPEMLEELSAELAVLARTLPKNRYHTEMISLKHELKENRIEL